MKVQEFPAKDMEVSVLLVVSDLPASRDWYKDVLGAELYREYGGTTAVFTFLGMWLILTTSGEATKDKPSVAMTSPVNPDEVSVELTIRVPDCAGAYEILKSRGAAFLTSPVTWDGEVRAFFRDPSGHLFEISEAVS